MFKNLFNICSHEFEKQLLTDKKGKYARAHVCKKCKLVVKERLVLTLIQGGLDEKNKTASSSQGG